MCHPGGRWVRILLSAAALAGLTLLAPFAPVASAASGVCGLSSPSQPFLPWDDPADYALVPGGDFEHGTWTFAGGAGRARGGEPYAATGKLGNWSLSLPAGSSAQSPSTCVGANEPTIRFFVAGSGTIEVEFVYGAAVIGSGAVAGGGEWTPSPIVVTGSVIPAAGTGNTEVSLRLIALSGESQVDDVFIDPWNRG